MDGLWHENTLGQIFLGQSAVLDKVQYWTIVDMNPLMGPSLDDGTMKTRAAQKQRPAQNHQLYKDCTLAPTKVLLMSGVTLATHTGSILHL